MNKAATLHFNIITLFPRFFDEFFQASLVGRAITLGKVTQRIVNLREFGIGAHRQVDAVPFGGGPGMLLRFDVLRRAHSSLPRGYTICLSPRGVRLTQRLVRELHARALEHVTAAGRPANSGLTLVCGHYEGIDQRFIHECVDLELSIGDYILGGGESAALVVMDALIRLQDTVVGNPRSLATESFEMGALLEYDQYTRPVDVQGVRELPPRVLRSGHHAAIAAWQAKNQLLVTYERRPQLLKTYPITRPELAVLRQYVYEKFVYHEAAAK